MSSSSDPAGTGRAPAAVLSAAEAGPLGTLSTPELREGDWTRLGGTALLGDRVTEHLLGRIADQVRAAARAQGYATGWAEGRRDAAEAAAAETRDRAEQHAVAEAARAAEHAAGLAALAAAAEQVRSTLGELTARIEGQATELAWRLTEALVGREVSVASAPDVVRRVLQVLPAEPVARVHLHPALLPAPAVGDLVERGLEVVADPRLDRGDALVETDGSVVDLRVGEALERVREVLR